MGANRIHPKEIASIQTDHTTRLLDMDQRLQWRWLWRMCTQRKDLGCTQIECLIT